MSKNDMVMVPRELLESLVSGVDHRGWIVGTSTMQGLKSALGAKQDNAVAIVDEDDDGFFAEWLPGDNGIAIRRGDKLYACSQPAQQHQGEPVALPAEQTRRTSDDRDEAWDNGWNACLDEIAKLGPLFMHPAPAVQQEPVAWVRFRNGEPDYDGDACMIMNVPGDTLGDGDSWEAVYAHPDTRMAGYALTIRELNKEHADEVCDLRTQLAKAHALLRECQPCLEKAGYGTWQIDELLSASAEPSEPTWDGSSWDVIYEYDGETVLSIRSDGVMDAYDRDGLMALINTIALAEPQTPDNDHLHRDAERYRALRDQPFDSEVIVWDIRSAKAFELGKHLRGKDLDAAVDFLISPYLEQLRKRVLNIHDSLVRQDLIGGTPLGGAGQSAPVEIDERAEFEAYWSSRLEGRNSFTRLHLLGRYIWPDVQNAWDSWQARAALARKP